MFKGQTIKEVLNNEEVKADFRDILLNAKSVRNATGQNNNEKFLLPTLILFNYEMYKEMVEMNKNIAEQLEILKNGNSNKNKVEEPIKKSKIAQPKK